MNKGLGLCIAILAGSLATTAAAHEEPSAVERGRYLVEFGGCHDCHTPVKFDPQLKMPVPDRSRMLSGHPEGAPDPEGKLGPKDMALIGPTFTSFALPFGVVYTANLTPDLDTGLGSWTEEMFVTAIRTGKHMGGKGRPILPPMPFLAVTSLSDTDLKAVFAYLKSIPPIRNAVPAPKVPEAVMMGIDKGNQAALKAHRAAMKPAPGAPPAPAPGAPAKGAKPPTKP